VGVNVAVGVGVGVRMDSQLSKEWHLEHWPRAWSAGRVWHDLQSV
jgi:hypothetical protein